MKNLTTYYIVHVIHELDEKRHVLSTSSYRKDERNECYYAFILQRKDVVEEIPKE